MVISGRADGDTRRLTIRVNVSNGEEPYRVIECEIDTASDVQLALSAQDIVELGLDQAGNIDYRSNGTSHDIPRYAAYVEWHDGEMSVYVVETVRPAYVGMGLLWDSFLSGYLFPNGAVTVSKMAHWDDLKREVEEK